MKKIITVLLDDEKTALAHLQAELSHFQRLDIRRTFTDPLLFFSYLDEHPEVQLLILDKEMKKLDGLDLIAQLPKHIACVMVTGHREFAVEAYATNVLDYVMKPVSRGRLAESVRKVEEKLNLSPSISRRELSSGIFVVRGEGRNMRLIIPYDELIYVQSAKDECVLYLLGDGEPLTVRERIGVIDRDLPDALFKRVHNEYIINKTYARKYESGLITLRAGGREKTVSIGDTYKEEVLYWLNDRLIGIK